MPTPIPSHISELDTKILLALLDAPATTYRIRKIMEMDSDYFIKVSNGSLLPAMKRLDVMKAVIRQLDGTYSITLKGKKLLQAEITIYIKLIYLSRQRGL